MYPSRSWSKCDHVKPPASPLPQSYAPYAPTLAFVVCAPDRAHPSYTIKELQKDINKQLEAITDEAERERLRESTKLGVFVVHNK